MKASELMIGDLVMASTYEEEVDDEVFHPARITAISSTNWNIEWLDDCESESCADLEPIPLTVEILEANGFERLTREIIDSKKYYYCFREDTALDDDGHQFYIIDIYTFDTCLSLLGILFVHELQHILRTIHKADLADNFKLKKDNQ